MQFFRIFPSASVLHGTFAGKPLLPRLSGEADALRTSMGTSSGSAARRTSSAAVVSCGWKHHRPGVQLGHFQQGLHQPLHAARQLLQLPHPAPDAAGASAPPAPAGTGSGAWPSGASRSWWENIRHGNPPVGHAPPAVAWAFLPAAGTVIFPISLRRMASSPSSCWGSICCSCPWRMRSMSRLMRSSSR